jgi:hypothetical protein
VYYRKRIREFHQRRGFFGRGGGGGGAGGGGAVAPGYAPEPWRQREVPSSGYAGAGADDPFRDGGSAPPYEVVRHDEDDYDGEEAGITSPGRRGRSPAVALHDLEPRPVDDDEGGKGNGSGSGRAPLPGRRLAGGPSESAVDLGTQHTPAEYV